MGKLLSVIGGLLARYLNKEAHHAHGVMPPNTPGQLLAALRPGDVRLVEGTRRVCTAIKYLTQSTWSHAALFIGREHHFSVPANQARAALYP